MKNKLKELTIMALVFVFIDTVLDETGVSGHIETWTRNTIQSVKGQEQA